MKQLHRDLSDEPETNHDDRFAEPGIGLTNALHCDRTNRRVGRVIDRHSIGKGRAEVARNEDDLCVIRVCRSGTRDAIADAKVRHAFADGRNDTGSAVTERLERLEPRPDLEHGRAQAFLSDVVDDLLDEIRSLPRLAEHGALAD